MKICILAPYVAVNGLGRVAANLTKVFEVSNREVDLLCRFDTDSNFDFIGSATFYQDYNQKSRLGFLGFLRFVYKELSLGGYDYVISIGPSYDVINAYFSKLIKYKAITSIHNNIEQSYSRLYKFLLPSVCSLSHKVAPVSEGLAIQLNKRTAQRYSCKIKSIPNPVEVAFNDGEIDTGFESGKYFVCVGRLAEQKALWHAISAFRFTRSDASLLILGEGDQRAMLESLVSKYSLEDKVKVLGFKSNPLDYVAKSKGLILTSLFEGLPMVIIETMALGVPTISVRCETGPEQILGTDSSCGLLLEHMPVSSAMYDSDKESPLDQELAQAVDYLMDNEPVYNAMKLECKSKSKLYSYGSVNNAWESLLHEK